MERKDYCHIMFQHDLKEEHIEDISVVELLKSINKWTNSTTLQACRGMSFNLAEKFGQHLV